jgi:hypothetical protein
VRAGFHRADRTAKPELESFLKVTQFLSGHRDALHGRADEEVLMLIPHSLMFSPRNFATEATRKCVRAMFYHCRIPLRAVSEHVLAETDSSTKMIIVPAPRVLTEKCWKALLAQAARGATIVISGVFDDDEHWLSTESRSAGIFGFAPDTGTISESESILIATTNYLVRYEGEKIQRIEKALMKANGPSRVLVKSYGAGRFVWSPLFLRAFSDRSCASNCSSFSFEARGTCNLATSRLPSQRPALRSEMVTACSSTRTEKVGFCNAMFVWPLA